MATQHLDPTDPAAGPSPELSTSLEQGGTPLADALAGYLRARATEFLRALRTQRETGGAAHGVEESADAALALRRSARRISGTLHTFRPLLDADWSEALRPELAWLSSTLAREHAYAARLERLVKALNRLSGASAFPTQSTAPRASDNAAKGNLTVGAAKAGALLDRRLTLARTRAHSAALDALGSARFHAVADSVAVLASEVPLTPAAATADLCPLAEAAYERLRDAVTSLPLITAGHPYNAEALIHG
ncbi:CHAD domain-containing protein, partial [Streptomyces phyllanthi]